jgi:polyribonucleotide 5'-hydroxyl-kinase
LEGITKIVYKASSTPMREYADVHKRLEDIRSKQDGNGPRVMVVGPPDSGKTSLCNILLSYGARAQRRIMFVDLDIADGSVRKIFYIRLTCRFHFLVQLVLYKWMVLLM